MSKLYGYIRVSSKEQNENRQVDALLEFGVAKRNLYLDKQSGKDFNRKRYQLLVHKKLTEQDVLVVKSIDRLGRNYNEILEEWRFITKTVQANIVVLDMPLLDTREGVNLIGTLIADIVLQLLSFVAESERENIRQRQAEGIAAAKARGVRFGRPRVSLPDNFHEYSRNYRAKNVSLAEVLNATTLKRSTFYRYYRNYLKSCFSERAKAGVKEA